jgi:carbonic anhydrase/acetyltransferase-like protein (isoleucine patch superfamily)
MKGVYALGKSIVPKIAERCWIAPNAAVIGNVIIGEASSVWFGVTVRGDQPEPITIGKCTNIQDNSVLHSDAGVPLTIGNNVTVGHQAMLHGCTIGDNTLIGIGATVLNHSVVGKNCIIGAHTLVPEGKTIPDGSLVMGVPGKIVKQLTEQQIESLKLSANHYVENAHRFRNELTPWNEKASKL